VIIYQASKSKFLDDSFKRDIQDVIFTAYQEKTGHSVSAAEIRSWKESLLCMAKVLNDDEIPGDSGVAIEYNIPATSKRVDFILTGRGPDKSANVIIVELKQWSEAKRTDKDAVVVTRLSGAECETNHPSYQAWSYAALLNGFNEAVYGGDMSLQPCAYLHNYVQDGVINHNFYSHYIERAPLFLKGDVERDKLREFIKRFVRYGDNANLMYRIENGRIRPSKTLADSLVKMMKGKQEFVLIDDQKIVYENAKAVARKASKTKKQVMIVEGGPGTGKSVVAINLLAALSKLGLNGRYVSKNAAPRTVYESMLTGTYRRTEISNFFSGSGTFINAEKSSFDVLIVDEAHRLNEKSGLYGNLGDHQIREIISAANCAIFFLDEDQRVTLKDIGSVGEIEACARKAGAVVSRLELASQFRCNGSDGYLSWLDDVLGVRETANPKLDVSDFDFRVFDSPVEMHELIAQRNRVNNKARVVAGYCWKWITKRQPDAFDIVIPEHDYRRRWNLSSDGSLWIVAEDSIDEVGCIHTSQGLEVDYVGVIIGPDFVVRGGKVVCQPENRASSDKSLLGYRGLIESDPKAGRQRVDQIIKNTYRTLMTRGMKGCYVYCTDPETAAYFRSRLTGTALTEPPVLAPEPVESVKHVDSESVFPFKRMKKGTVRQYVNALPLIDLKIAAGAFGDIYGIDDGDVTWVQIPDGVKPKSGMFIAQVVGESMNRKIPNGSWCLFKANPEGTRQGKVVVAQHRSVDDPETGGSYTVKLYSSKKIITSDGSWRHTSVTLTPQSTDPMFVPIELTGDAAGSVQIVAELIAILT
jgi:DUF2075 family protein